MRSRLFVCALRPRSAFSAVLLLAFGLLPAGDMTWAGGNREAPVAQDGSAGPRAAKLPFPKPESHNGRWLEFHSRVAPPSGAGFGGSACLTCHERGDCINCHATRPPRDHTSSWRTRTHGFAAGADSQRCSVCHRQDTCVRCHNETPPRTHRGSWVTDHCSWCHYGPAKTVTAECGVCHKAAPH